MRRYVPSIDWLQTYRLEDFKGDLPAGLTVGVMLIPQGMAYAMIAGLPVVYDLIVGDLMEESIQIIFLQYLSLSS